MYLIKKLNYLILKSFRSKAALVRGFLFTVQGDSIISPFVFKTKEV